MSKLQRIVAIIVALYLLLVLLDGFVLVELLARRIVIPVDTSEPTFVASLTASRTSASVYRGAQAIHEH